MSDTSQTAAGTDRRRLLSVLGAGGAALLVTQVPREDAEAAHDGTNVLHLGETNTSPAGSLDGGTVLNGATTTGAVLDVSNTATDAGAGVAGTGTTIGVNGAGRVGVWGTSTDANGGTGVWGEAIGTATQGGRFQSAGGTGVQGLAPGEDPAIQAWSTDLESLDGDGGLALQVIGRARFSTGGVATLPAGAVSVFVPNVAVRDNSHVTVTPVTDPGPRSVRWVDRDPGVGFTVHMTSAPVKQRPSTDLSYLIAEFD